MHILNYYRESATRSEKREYILRTCRRYFSYNNQQDASMTEIAKYLKLERRTLYYYYNNKEELVLDVYLYFSEKFCDKDLKGSEKLFEKLKDQPYKEMLKKYFERYVKYYAAEQEKSASVIDIDNFVYNLEEGSEAFERYIYVIEQIRRGYDRIVTLFEKAIEAGQLNIKYSEAKATYYTIEQVLRTYIIKRWAMRKFNDTYPMENLYRILNILIDGL